MAIWNTSFNRITRRTFHKVLFFLFLFIKCLHYAWFVHFCRYFTFLHSNFYLIKTFIYMMIFVCVKQLFLCFCWFVYSLQNIEFLSLDNNEIQTLPVEICALSTLKELHAAGNQMTSLPLEFGYLTQLEKLFIQKNKIRELPEVCVRERTCPRVHVLCSNAFACACVYFLSCHSYFLPLKFFSNDMYNELLMLTLSTI